MEQQSIRAALDEISFVRNAVVAQSLKRESQILETSFSANKVVQQFTLIMCALHLVVEVTFGNYITRTMIQKNAEPFYKFLGITSIAAILFVSLSLLYVLVWKAARRQGEGWGAYVKKNFSYLSSQATVSDLFIKFAVISTLIYFEKPQLVSPFLFLFIADYLFQRRFFTLSTKASNICGGLALTFGILQLVLENSLVIWPLVFFGLVNVISLRHLKSLERVEM